MTAIDLDAKVSAIHQSIEDMLVDFRDSRISQLAANGLVVREKDGTDSSVIRIGTRQLIRIVLEESEKWDEQADGREVRA